MCVKPEQASKVKSWTPTRLGNGEGRVRRGRNRRLHPLRSTGVLGTARRKGDAGNWGGPLGTRVAPSTSPWAAVPAGVGQGHSTAEAG